MLDSTNLVSCSKPFRNGLDLKHGLSTHQLVPETFIYS